MSQPPNSAGADIAVVGLAGRFPGANSPEELWRNVRAGVESIRRLSEEELLAAGVPAASLADPHYVRACAPLDAMEEFDASFFGFSPRDASILDPQHRHFFECAWEALESAGHPPERFSGSIGVFAGCGMGAYFAFNLLSNPELVRSTGLFLLRHTGNDKDFLPTRVSYLLNLTGPSLAIQTACSTSLVAIHVAAQHLLNGECDMALAGGVTIEVPHRVGYHFEPGEILSPDGHCRAFDAASQGTVFGSGVGVVVLRRLQDAIDDGDEIHAVIKGSAVNNDGGSKVGYLAPGVEGQSASIAEALAVAGITADAISYVETHGTGTPVGDPIEIAALTQAFRQTSTRSGFCAIGSLKTNIGHLDTAAGVASFIKVVQALEHRELPPSLFFESPNPSIDFARSPFYVNATLKPWPSSDLGARRAGVSALGVGGTNAHVILEEAPPPPPATASRVCYPLLLSARTPTALDALTWRYAAHFARRSSASLADAAYTTAVGRRAFEHRRALVCHTVEDAAVQLRAADPLQTATGRTRERVTLVMMFPGGGAQHPGMATDLYREEPVFRDAVERCLAVVARLGHDGLRPLMFPSAGSSGAGAGQDDIALALERPSISILAVFIIEWALAQLWLSWGLTPAACIGHSLGEYVAACLAEVVSIEDALAIVVKRGEIFERLPAGGMLSVSLKEEAVRALPTLTGLSIAAVNAPELTVLSGPHAAVERAHQELTRAGVEARRLHIAVAAHSAALDPYLDEFRDFVGGLSLKPAIRPFVSNITGTWVDPVEAATADYWTRHLRSTVRFSQGLTTILADPDCVLLEVGPGQSLSAIARQHRVQGRTPVVVPSLRHPTERDGSDAHVAYAALGRLWTEGVEVDWARFYARETRRRTTLPTYAFDHERHWIAPGGGRHAPDHQVEPFDALVPLGDISQWTYRWCEEALPIARGEPKSRRTFLVLSQGSALSSAFQRRVSQRGERLSIIDPATLRGEQWSRIGEDADVVVYLAAAEQAARVNGRSEDLDEYLKACFDSPLKLMQSLGEHSSERPLWIAGVSIGLSPNEVEGTAQLLQGALAGPLLVASCEYPSWSSRMIDLPVAALGTDISTESADSWASRLLEELERPAPPTWVSVREHAVTTRVPEQVVTTPDAPPVYPSFRDRGAYLITGGTGGMGLAIATYLAHRYHAKIALLGRSATSLASDVVRSIQAAGATVVLLDGDVSSRESIAASVVAAENACGALHGVIHAAGVMDDGLLALKTVESARRVLAPKIAGTLALHDALGARPLDFVALCSSTSATLALPGQADYMAANAFLNTFAAWRTRAGYGRTVAIEWGTWRDVGMAARALHQLGGRSRDVASNAVHPLLGSCESRTDDAAVYVSVLDADATWVLREHQLKSGIRVLPGTAYVEVLRALCAELTGSAAVQIDDLTFVAPFEVEAGRTRPFRVSASRVADQSWYVTIESASGDGAWDEHARARIAPHVDGVEPPRTDYLTLRQRASRRIGPGDDRDVKSKQEQYLTFGAHWNVVRELHVGGNEAVALLGVAAEHQDEFATFGAHPGLLDFAGAVGLAASDQYDSCTDLFIPVAYGQLKIGSLASAAWSHARVRPSGEPRSVVLDFDVYDTEGRVIASAVQFVMRRVAPPALVSNRGASSQEVRSGASIWLERAVRAGIGPQLGPVALDRVLASLPGPSIVVSSVNLFALRSAVKSLVQPSRRPARTLTATSGRTVAPLIDPIESAIGAVWEEVLGVTGVGANDDFLQLGGHSLMAVRVATRLQRRFSAPLPLASLLELRTIGQLAQVVRSALNDRAAAERTVGDEPPVLEPSPLVAVSRDAFRVKRASLVADE
ncbi:MAG: SDR family NAD(P)-dependent oxidoreductase [Vicinamibacterales bacterium]